LSFATKHYELQQNAFSSSPCQPLIASSRANPHELPKK